MTRLSEMLDPDAIVRRFEERVSILEKQNPLNNASFDGKIRFEAGATIEAGEVTILENGIELPWGAGRQSLRTILDAIDGRARAGSEGAADAMARANSAHDRIDTVSNNASNAMNRANTAHDRIDIVSGNLSYVNDRVDTVSARATNALNAANTAQSRADSAYSLAEGRVTQTQRNVIIAKINQIIAVMATEGGNPKPPPIQS